MYIALDKEQKRISIKDAVQGDAFFCPVCLEKMFVKAGTERARHFSHFPNCECNDSWNGQYDMSDWHYEWQNQFPAKNQEVVVQCDDIRHRADVLTDRTVVEFQHSPLSSGKFNDRNVFYHGNIGYKVVWLYDMREDYEQDLLVESDSNGYFLWNKPRSTFRKYNLRAGEIDLFFQIADEGECILHIQAFTNDGFCMKRKYTKDAFLAYVGLINGVCPPPLHLDTQIDEDFRVFSEKYNIKLNPQQQRAVQAVSGANLMIAVPGSGKTTVMVARMGYMIYCKRIAPENILAITYTVSATNDIKRRFAAKFEPEMASRLNIRTINSLCEQIIKRYVQKYNRQRFTLLKEDEQIAIIRKIYIELTGDKFPHDSDIIEAQTVISYIKNMMMTTPELRAEYLQDGSIYEFFFNIYDETLKSQRRMDFDDQLIFTKIFIEKVPSLLDELQNQYKYICVDEAQDTSKIQHEIIRILASKTNNIFMVGDEDQSIYRFRAAYPRALLDFTDTYTNPYILFLETNYRSTKPIVSAAQRFISQNINRHSEKHMVASRGDGKPIERITVRRKHQQYSSIAAISKGEHAQMAVLYRNNGSAIPLMDLFLRENIPFNRLKDVGENFFTSKVVQDIVYFLRFALNQNDAEAFNHVYYKCGYGFNKNAAYWSCKKAQQKRITIADELVNQMERWPTLMRKAEDFRNKFKKIAASKPDDAIDLICRFWYYAYAKEKELDIGKVDILYSLAVREETIKGFLERLSLIPRLIESYRCTEQNPVILSTIHSAKGLEFDTVYIVDVYDGCLPHSSREDAQEQERIDNYEEERRLFYVAITRAKNELHLFYVSECESGFVNEVAPPVNTPKEPVKHHPDIQIKGPRVQVPSVPKVEDPSVPIAPELAAYIVNTRIKHDAYGEGIIVGSEIKQGGLHIIEVQFDNGNKNQFQLDVVVNAGLMHLA